MQNTTKELGNERLLELAEHLENGKLGHEKFDFNCYNTGPRDGAVPYKCGTNGCALGEMPILKPDEWFYDREGIPRLKGVLEIITSAEIYFALDMAAIRALFYPYRQDEVVPELRILKNDATKEAVAANIRLFVERRRQGLYP